MSRKLILDKNGIDQKLNNLAREILDNYDGAENLALIGIKTRGEFIAHRIVKKIRESVNITVPTGAIDITLYRDDFRNKKDWPQLKKTEIDFDIQGKNIVLVDDVIFTGRTVRAAIGVLMDYGRPLSVKLAVLVDRGHRELPIQPDFKGIEIDTGIDEQVNVLLDECDEEEEVNIE